MGLATKCRDVRIAQNCDNDKNEGGGAVRVLRGIQGDPLPGYCSGGFSRVLRLSVATEPRRLEAVAF